MSIDTVAIGNSRWLEENDLYGPKRAPLSRQVPCDFFKCDSNATQNTNSMCCGKANLYCDYHLNIVTMAVKEQVVEVNCDHCGAGMYGLSSLTRPVVLNLGIDWT